MENTVSTVNQNSLSVVPDEVMSELTVSDVKNQIQKLQQLMQGVMKEGEHYGVIPGTEKPTLLKSGAEKINFVFRLAPEYEIKRDDLQNGHREYQVICKLNHITTGNFISTGVGICSTMEKKYRYRNEYITEEVGYLPKEYWNIEDEKQRQEFLVKQFGKGKYQRKKVDGSWKALRITGDGKIENPDLADVYNTVLKMAKKRAYVDATLTGTAASDFFAQDLEDFIDEHPEKETVTRKEESKQPTTEQSESNLTPKQQVQLRGSFEQRDIEKEIKAITRLDKLSELATNLSQYKPVLTDAEYKFIKKLILDQGHFIDDALKNERLAS